MNEENSQMQAASIRHAVGPTIMLGSGTYFDYLAPQSSAITIEDVAYGLGFTTRFRGQCRSARTGDRVFYSVAEHCVRMSDLVLEETGSMELAYDALMHELGEVVCADLPGPLKALCSDYKAIEKQCQAALEVAFGVTMRDPDLIKRYDLRMLATEQRDITAGSRDKWSHTEGAEPFNRTIIPWPMELGIYKFLACADKLRPALGRGRQARAPATAPSEDMPARPRRLNPEQHLILAKEMARKLIDYNPMVINDPDRIAADLMKCTDGRHLDGFDIAKALERECHWQCDSDMVDTLDEWSFMQDDAIRALEIAWAATNKIRPALSVGDKVEIGGGETGTIDGIYEHGGAKYLVKVDGDPHAEEPALSRRIVDFENAVRAEAGVLS
jgi:hypothetical protein